MKKFILAFVLVTLAVLPLQAQDNAELSFGSDRFVTGNTVRQSAETAGDVFAAGGSVRVDAPTAGSVHLAGRDVSVAGAVGENVYAAGQDVKIDAPVGGNATLLGQFVSINAAVTGNIRAAGQDVLVNSEISGSAMLAGERLRLDGAVLGDVIMAGNNLEFGDNARIDGTLTIHHAEPDSVEVPDSVAPADRIERVVSETGANWKAHGADMVRPSFMKGAFGWVGSVVMLAVAALIFAALFPKFVANARAAALARPLRALWVGFLGLSATIGSLFLLASTGVGLLLVPVSIVLALALGFLGYVLAAYIAGVAALALAGREMPDSFADRALAALSGAIVVSLLVLIPFIGWWVTLALIWGGVGAILVRLIGPRFFGQRAGG